MRVTVLVGAVLCIGQPLHAQLEQIVVKQVVRPLEQATRIIESRCECVVTYEDVRYDASQVEDVTRSVRRDGKSEPRVFSPRGSVLSFPYEHTASGNARADVVRNVNAAIALFNSSRTDRVAFRLVDGSKALHVIPDVGSVLSTGVSLTEHGGTAYDLIKAVVAEVGKASHTKVNIFGMEGLLTRTRTHLDENGRADDLIMTAFRATNRRLSWKLLYNFADNFYVLNIIDAARPNHDK